MAHKEIINGNFEWVNEEKTWVRWVDDPKGKYQKTVFRYNLWESLLIWFHLKKDIRYDGTNYTKPPTEINPSDYIIGIDPYDYHEKPQNNAEKP